MDEPLRRGFAPVLAGRSAERLAAVAPWHAALEQRVVGVDTLDLLREALGDVGVVVNCAGPFLDAALALAQAEAGLGQRACMGRWQGQSSVLGNPSREAVAVSKCVISSTLPARVRTMSRPTR